MQRILHLSDAQDWHDVLSRLNVDDVYFLPEYLRVNEWVTAGQAECFVFENASGVALYPYVKRHIPGTELYDITSAYGFGGCLMTPDSQLALDFNAAFKNHCRESGIVSEFIRFHPLLKNHALLDDATLHIENHHQTVRAHFPNGVSDLDGMVTKEARKKIRKAEKKGVEVVIDTGMEHYAAFMELYDRTMNHKNATQFYFFDARYFHQMRELLRDRLCLLVAFYQGKLVGGLLLFHCGEFTYNHLSGSDYDHRNLGVNDILQYKAMEWAAERGCRHYLLGGGMSGEDSLFQFKAKFSPDREDYHVGKRIHLRETYDMLCRKKIRDEGSSPKEFLERDWFPLYRSEPPKKAPVSQPAAVK